MSEVDFKDPSSWDYGNIFKGLFGTGATYAAVDDILNRLTSAGQGLSEEFPKIGIEAANRAAFKPFTVTTGTGGIRRSRSRTNTSYTKYTRWYARWFSV